MTVELDEKAISAIQEIISAEKVAEVALKNGRLFVWETRSKKKYDAVITRR